MSIPAGVASNRLSGGPPPGKAPAPLLFARFLGGAGAGTSCGVERPRFFYWRAGVALNTGIPYIGGVTSDFDPVKDEANRAKHGLSLAFGASIFADPDHLVIPSIRAVDGEERFKVIGLVERRLFTAVFVWRGGKPRFISVRRSNAGEDRAYHSGV